MNELDVQWVGREDWIFRAYVRHGGGTSWLRKQIYLSCDSLDTIADVSLNGQKVGSSDNMFSRRRFDAKPFLRAREERNSGALHLR